VKIELDYSEPPLEAKNGIVHHYFSAMATPAAGIAKLFGLLIIYSPHKQLIDKKHFLVNLQILVKEIN
jgi:hypothetical protein